ncbi:TPA: hypothetical protein DEP58_01655 [Patescibacteria group bacterium]|nr:hypothetical protein [Patescibacteria group bacterium]
MATLGTKNISDVSREDVVGAFAKQGNKKALEMQKNAPTLNTTQLNPQGDMKLTPPPVPVQGAGLQGTITATQDAYTKKVQDQTNIDRANFNTSRTDIQTLLAELKGQTGLTNEAYAQKGGVDAVQTELNDINQKILVEQQGLQRQIEKLEKNSRGMLQGGLQDQLEDVERESIRKQADLSIIQMGVQGRYDSAKAIADRAVSAYMEKQDLILKTAMFNYTENKELFTTAEQREFETLAQNRQNEIDTQKAEKKSIYDLGLQAQLDGAPTSVIESIFSAKTKEEALQLGSQYIGAQDRALKAEQIASARRANQPTPNEVEYTYDGNNVSVPSFESYKETKSNIPKYDAWRVMLGLPNTIDVKKRYDDAVKKEESTLKQKYQDEKELVTRASAVQKISPLAREVLQNPKGYFDLTPTKRGEILTELANAGIDTGQLQSGKKQKLSATQADDLVQAQIAYQGVQNLKGMLDELDQTGPVIGRLREMNPYDPQVVAIMAEINRIVPGLARGVFKEVGVLTDTDINRYTATLANPRATPEQVMALHEDTMKKIEQSLEIIEDTYSQLGYDLGTFEFKKQSNDVPQEAMDILSKYGINQ